MATATSASLETIRDAATSDRGEKPTRATTLPYRDVLERLWILDPVPAWLPRRNRLARLSSPPKHHLVDPALAARLLGVDADALLHPRPTGPPIPRDGTLLGALFESLVTLCVRVYAQASEAQIAHLRTWSGDREVDLIVDHGRQILALEVKLGQVVDDRDVRTSSGCATNSETTLTPRSSQPDRRPTGAPTASPSYRQRCSDPETCVKPDSADAAPRTRPYPATGITEITGAPRPRSSR